MTDAAGVARQFRTEFSSAPDTVWSAPGRVNLIGEHTDYNGGLVAPFAIEERTVAAARGRSDSRLRVRSVQHPLEPYDGTLDDPPPTGWAAYAAGALFLLRSLGMAVRGADLLVDSDLPEGAGLSSSAALECAVVAAIGEIFDLGLAPDELAATARAVENDIVGVPCGPMDQVAAVFGRAGRVIVLDCASGDRRLLPFDPATAGAEVVIVDTGIRHALADGKYAERRHRCERAAAILGVDTLSQITEADLSGALARLPDPNVRAACRHVVSENARVTAAAAALGTGRTGALGPLLTASHRSLRDDYDVSCAELDLVVDVLLDRGALGARMTGAGFGGSVVALIESGSRDLMLEALTAACATTRQPPPTMRPARPCDGLRRESGRG